MIFFLAILKIIFLSTLGSGILGAIFGYIIYGSAKGDTNVSSLLIWKARAKLIAIFGFIISVVCCFIFKDNLDENLIKSVVISVICSQAPIIVEETVATLNKFLKK